MRGSNAALLSLVYYSPKLVLANWGRHYEAEAAQPPKSSLASVRLFAVSLHLFFQSNKSSCCCSAIFYNWGIRAAKKLVIWAEIHFKYGGNIKPKIYTELGTISHIILLADLHFHKYKFIMSNDINMKYVYLTQISKSRLFKYLVLEGHSWQSGTPQKNYYFNLQL